MKVSKILKRKVKYDHSVNKICDNHLQVENKDILFCIKGFKHDGNDYIKEVINNCIINNLFISIVSERIDLYLKYNNCKCINFILVKDARESLAKTINIMYQNISRKLNIIGITGTNGKTTTSTLIYKYLKYNNIKACLIGTNGIYIENRHIETSNTTISIIETYKYLDYCYKNNINYVIMEVSSQGISMKRVYGIYFKIKALTNITLDHLDYHKTFENYKKTKLDWLKSCKNGRNIVLNLDSSKVNFSKLINYPLYSLKRNIYLYSSDLHYVFNIKKHILIKNINLLDNKSDFDLVINKKTYHFDTFLKANFNIYNITLFISILYALNMYDYKAINSFLNTNIEIEGRMISYLYKNRRFIIDFAHTPDGIEKVLSYLNQIKKKNIISVCGCGGDRDKSKRKIMGNILSNYSYITIFTMDNPRSEDINDIFNDMLEDNNYNKNNNIMCIINRKEAILKAYELSKGNDIIVILGRGNENKQIIKDKIIYECDIDIVKEIINNE